MALRVNKKKFIEFMNNAANSSILNCENTRERERDYTKRFMGLKERLGLFYEHSSFN